MGWWYDLGGHDSPASDYLAATSPFYAWFKSAQEQFDAYAPASHVGKINRGSFLNPELNLPAHRAFGHNSDFNVGDLSSGAFSHTPQAQRSTLMLVLQRRLAKSQVCPLVYLYRMMAVC